MGLWNDVIQNQANGMDIFSAYEKAEKDNRNKPVFREIRFLDEGDLDKIDDFERIYREEGDVHTGINFEDVRDTITYDEYYIGAIENGKLVGIVSIGGADDFADRDEELEKLVYEDGAVISDLYVIPERRENGIGSELMNKALEYADEQFKHQAYVDILYDELEGFYERFGFEQIDLGTLAVDLPSSKPIDKEQDKEERE